MVALQVVREIPQSNSDHRNAEQIRNAREDLIQGNADDYFPTVQTGERGARSFTSPNLPDIPEEARYSRQSNESTLRELGPQVDSPSSVYTVRPCDPPLKLMVREESVDSQVLLRPPFGPQFLATPDYHPKPILKQSLDSLLAEKRSSLHDILSTAPDQESLSPRRVSFADEDEVSHSVAHTGIEDSALSVSELDDSTTTKHSLRGITRMLLFELERSLTTSTPTPNNGRNSLPRSSSLTSVTEPEPSVDFVRVVPWDDRGYRSGLGRHHSGSWKQVKTRVFSWCNRHSHGFRDGGPKRLVELRKLPIGLQDWILEFERKRIEQTQGHGKGMHRIVHIDVSQVLNPS